MQEAPTHAMYLAVLPAYRAACIAELKAALPDLEIYCSDAHLDRSVKTGISYDLFERVHLLRLSDKAFIQTGHWRRALLAKNLVLDLNPRSLTAWTLLGLRRCLARRTLVWGHLHPRAGAETATAGLRKLMRSIATGTVTYTYSSAAAAKAEKPNQTVWVAPNSLYTRADLTRSAPDRPRLNLLYVGRLEAPKKVSMLIDAFSKSRLPSEGVQLILIGDGSQRPSLEAQVGELRLEKSVKFEGWIDSVDILRDAYSRSFASTSPGFAGLSLTQSLGFGVPMVVSRDEPHAPEIELAEHGGVTWATTDNTESWAASLNEIWDRRHEVPNLALKEFVSLHYSAESMAAGLADALTGTQND